MNPWRHIASAPRDGTVVELSWMENNEPQDVCHMFWDKEGVNTLVSPNKGIWMAPDRSFTWTEDISGGGPTHWRPIARH